MSENPSDMYEQSNSTANVQENIYSGTSIEGKVKMGSGTRDQAEVKLKGKGATTEEAAEEFEQALQAAEEGDWGHRLLQLNPERDDDE